MIEDRSGSVAFLSLAWAAMLLLSSLRRGASAPPSGPMRLRAATIECPLCDGSGRDIHAPRSERHMRLQGANMCRYCWGIGTLRQDEVPRGLL